MQGSEGRGDGSGVHDRGNGNLQGNLILCEVMEWVNEIGLGWSEKGRINIYNNEISGNGLFIQTLNSCPCEQNEAEVVIFTVLYKE